MLVLEAFIITFYIEKATWSLSIGIEL